MMDSPTIWPLLVLVISLAFMGSPASSAEISVPLRFKSEGRVTMTYQEHNKTVNYHLAFSESVNSIDMESVISIGYVSYTPQKYYARNGGQKITLNSDGSCKVFKKNSVFVPEFAWFLELMLPEVDLIQYTTTNPHMIGPSGFISLLISMTKGTKFEKLKEQIVYRNIPCDVYSKTFRPPLKGFALKFELYMPGKGVQFKNLENTYFSVKSTASFDNGHEHQIQDVSLIIDFFNIDSMDNDLSKFDQMRDDYNLPLASGCSEFVKQVQPQIYSQSFSLNYKQATSSSSYLLAYDHISNFLRRETYGVSVGIWDLNEDLMYHIDNNITNMMDREAEYMRDHLACSVLKVTDTNLSPAFRPYEKIGESVSVLKMLGGSSLAYMGQGTERDLPCYIYETILPEAPILFAMTGEHNKTSEDRDYIVQFYLLRGEETGSKFGIESAISESAFWPVKVVLYRRDKKSRSVDYIDHLDIYDFFWSLDGWNKKNNELFMASECFDDEDEQLNLELAMTFDRIHHGAVKLDDKKLLTNNKYKLEFDLVNDIFDLLQTNKMHLVDYELRLRPHHIDLNMVIGDRKENKNLTYFGTGKLPKQYSPSKHQVFLTQISERDCVATSSLLVDISLVIHCPTYEGSWGLQPSTCLMITDQVEPIIVDEKDSNESLCQVYRFTPTSVPKSGTISVNENKSKLIGHEFSFMARSEKGAEIFRGSVRTYDISHRTPLITINHYMFTYDQNADSNDNIKLLANQNVRSFNAFSYDSLGDCIRICNLDANCRSYSYCSNKSDNQCILTSLDIRGSNLQDQLIHSQVPISEGKTISVEGQRGRNYSLQFSDRCDIYERDYLNMFRQTEEVVRLQRKMVNLFRRTLTTFECAKQSVELELNSPNQFAMFAYCATSNTCLLDENLFASANDSTTTNKAKEGETDELLCRVYRKKYQTYFDVSPKVLTKQSSQQIELEFGTVEECSRACWSKFGQVCASFDYCSPNSCLINQIRMDSSGAELETRPNCLHYERDLKLDELRRQHMIGRHQLLQEQPEEARTFGSILLSIVSYCLVFGAFVYGLVLGRQVNDKMEAVTILRQSISAGSGQPARAQLSRYMESGGGLTDNQTSFDNMPDHFDSNAIRLSVIKNGNSEDHEPLDQDF